MEEIEKSMYYGAKPETFEAARILRKNMTSKSPLGDLGVVFSGKVGGPQHEIRSNLSGTNSLKS